MLVEEVEYHLEGFLGICRVCCHFPEKVLHPSVVEDNKCSQPVKQVVEGIQALAVFSGTLVLHGYE